MLLKQASEQNQLDKEFPTLYSSLTHRKRPPNLLRGIKSNIFYSNESCSHKRKEENEEKSCEVESGGNEKEGNRKITIDNAIDEGSEKVKEEISEQYDEECGEERVKEESIEEGKENAKEEADEFIEKSKEEGSGSSDDSSYDSSNESCAKSSDRSSEEESSDAESSEDETEERSTRDSDQITESISRIMSMIEKNIPVNIEIAIIEQELRQFFNTAPSDQLKTEYTNLKVQVLRLIQNNRITINQNRQSIEAYREQMELLSQKRSDSNVSARYFLFKINQGWRLIQESETILQKDCDVSKDETLAKEKSRLTEAIQFAASKVKLLLREYDENDEELDKCYEYVDTLEDDIDTMTAISKESVGMLYKMLERRHRCIYSEICEDED